MKWLSLANLQHAYARLSPRERFLVATAGAALVAFLLFFTIYEAEKAKSGLRERIVAKQRQLERVESLVAAYSELKRQTGTLLNRDPARSGNWLYSTIEGMVTKSVARDKVHSMNPSSKTIGDQYVEDSVSVELLSVSLQQTVEVLHSIEQSDTPLHVSRLQMKKRVGDPYQFDVTFAVSSIKAAG